MKYAVIQTGGKQYRVCEGDEIVVDRLEGKENEKLTFDQVLLFFDEGKTKIGQPYLVDTQVTGRVIAQVKGEKIRVAVYKAKSRYRRVKGHRQPLTKIGITQITQKGSAVAKS